MPLSKDGKQLLAAISSTKIAQAGDEEIKEALRYAMILVGIRAQNLPNDIEKQVLLQFIRRNYPGHTANEIRLAFDKAVSGELALKPNETAAYENFSCEYLGRIMRAYRAWASEQYEQAQTFQATETPKLLEAPKISDAELFETYFQDWKAGKLNLDLLPEFVYDRLKTYVKVEISDEEIKGIVLKAREHILERYNNDLKSINTDKRLGEYLEISAAKDKLKALHPLDSCEDTNVNRYAKALALVYLFRAAEKYFL